MTKVIRFTSDYLCRISDYGFPERRRHPTAHLVIADAGVLHCKVGSLCSEREGIMIRSGVAHEIQANGRMIVFLIANPSGITELMNQKFLTSSDYAVLPVGAVSDIQKICRQNTGGIDIQILKMFGIDCEEKLGADERILTVIAEIESVASITKDIMELLCKKTYLTQKHLWQKQKCQLF